MRLNIYILLIVFYSSVIFCSHGQGIRGYITDDKNIPLAFATIYVDELGTGTSANADAYYELKLQPGEYTVFFKFIGYETLTKNIKIDNEFMQLNIALVPQVLLLKEVVTSAKATDPANWMMRRAIAKSSYNRQLIDGYSAKVYVKGKGRVTDIPFYLKGALKKEGIDTSTQIITESVSKVSFKRPNQFSEKVLSVYASKKTDFNANPMPYIASSFYQDEVANAISPLSSKAFQYYKFKHLGAFMDAGKLINRIAITPKVRGPNVFKGEIQLVEDEWTLYSLDLSTQIDYGIQFRIKQVYQFINEAAWMPITHQINVNGEIMGVDFIFDYLASVSNYDIQLNPALPRNITIAESTKKSEKVLSSDEQTVKNVKQLKQESSETATIAIDKLPDIMEEYEEQQRDSIGQMDILAIYDFEYDSAAYSQDSSFWNRVRPIPLSKDESKSYKKIDSLSIIQTAEDAADSIKNVKRGSFEITDIITGGSYTIDSTNKISFIIYNALLGTQFNTVDGLNTEYSIGIKKVLPYTVNKNLMGEIDYTFYRTPYFLIKPTFRYAFAREKFNGQLLLKYRFPTGSVALNGGSYVSQINNAPPLTPLMNTSFTLLWEQNLMKLYERKFVDLNYKHKFSSKFRVEGKIGFEQRFKLYNNKEYSFIDWKRAFTPNLPRNVEVYSDFNGHKALTASFNAYYKPFVKYIIRNGVKQPVRTNSAEFSLALHTGIPNVLGSEVNFNRIELGFKNQFDFNAKGMSFVNLKVGGFLSNKALDFMDYAHFPGNRSFITQADPVASFRLLDYYYFSTDEYYMQSFLFHKFRKFLITQIPATRFFGLEEGFFANYLLTNNSQNYTELGYSLGGIFKFFRIEIATQYEDFQYKGWGVRVGVSTNLGGQIRFTSDDNDD